ncbi:adenylate/guanylate cyclase domain-containing protein [Shimia sediminis]|uniref:adenylate/guanylate cyclase domain-containing protein n=1 Tax=Shimia sediminis TaxID=2497945 RepID=UPI000F8F782E|nr:adenylate/guanylate cyclase domain-containing protein [Shimia sediminis]
MERRLTTILAADIVGFSRLVGRDEEKTLRQRRAHLTGIIQPLLETHSGRVANTAGDSLLVEFASTVAALRFALALQTQVEAANATIPEPEQMLYRIGINLGDVVAEGEDLLGDGVNIAARLEALAPTGGILISRSVRDQARDRMALDLNDLGEITVKNIARPVHTFQVVRTGEARMSPPRTQKRARGPRAALAMAAAVVIGAGVWWQISTPDFAPVDPAAMSLKLPERPSIAVLPFTSVTEDSTAASIGNALTENIISTLSLSPDMVVMGRATSLAYKDRQISPRDVAQELGVRYVLSGSVLKSGEKARVTAELSDALRGEQLWSIREDVEIDDLFDVQDHIAEKLFLELQVALTVGESVRTIAALSGDFETSVRVVQGRDAFQRFNPEGHNEAIRIWSQILTDNPDSPMGPYLLAWIPWQRVIIGTSDNIVADLQKTRDMAQQALAMQEWGDPYTLIALVENGLGNFDAAKAAADRALELSPGGGDVNAIGGLALYSAGEAKRGLQHMLMGMRLEPDYPEWLPGALYPALLEDGQYDEVISLARAVLSRDMRDARAHFQAHGALIAALVFKGEVQAAQSALRALQDQNPDVTINDLTIGRTRERPRAFHQDLVNAYIAAGVPSAAD